MKMLLEKTRKVNRVIQNATGHTVDFNELASVLKGVMECDVFIANRRGRILGSSENQVDETANPYAKPTEDFFFSASVNDQLLSMRDTSINTNIDGTCSVAPSVEYSFDKKVSAVVPVYGGGERLGTLIMVKSTGEFGEHELILSEFGATVVGLEVLRTKSDEAEDDQRKKAAVQIALSTLSYSELEAVEHIFNELGGSEGLLVASKIADRVGITRSVIVNALRKFESAGVIESRSLGMKGTYIRVKNDRLIDELRRMRAR